MAGQTSHYGLTRLEGGESFSTDGYKYTNADRDTIDRLLYVMGESHHHLGSSVTLTEPTIAPVLARSSGGSIPAGTRVYYKYSYLSVRGEETKASPESFIDMPAAILEPGAPTLTQATTGGTLTPGDYYYVLSAYVGSSIFETRAINPIYITVPLGTITNKITLTYPSPPAGMSGWNIYRRAPGEMKYFYLTSVASGPTTLVDTGSIAADCDRTIASLNTTNNNNKVTITLPGATPTVPVGYTWRIYRTFILSNYDNSTLKTVVEYTAETTPRVVAYYVDIGISTTSGKPLAVTVSTANPAKILLDSATEVQGRLAPANIAGYPYMVQFSYSGTVATGTGTFVWYCEFDHAVIQGCRAVLGVGKSPASTSVIVDVNVGRSLAATPTALSTIYTTQSNRPTITVGNQFSTLTVPNRRTLLLGDMLSVDIDQAGGGATPTDANMLVTVYLWVVSDKVTSVIP